MRFLLLAVLCLFAIPAKAEVFHVQNGQYVVFGDFGEWGIRGSIGYTFGVHLNPGIYDPNNGPFFGYDVTVRVNDGIVQECFFSQTMSMCGRNVALPMAFNVSDFEGDGTGFLNVSGVVRATNMTVSEFDMYVSLPAGYTIAAVPEPSTWIMMLIGFLGIALMVKLNKRQPLRRVGRLPERLQHDPRIAG